MSNKITVKMVKSYQKEQQEILMKYINIEEGTVIEQKNPFEMIPKDKIGEFTSEMQDLEYKYLCKIEGVEYSEDMDFLELSKIIKNIKNKYKLNEPSFGALIQKFL